MKPSTWTKAEELKYRLEQQKRNEIIRARRVEQEERRENVKRFSGEPVTNFGDLPVREAA